MADKVQDGRFVGTPELDMAGMDYIDYDPAYKKWLQEKKEEKK